MKTRISRLQSAIVETVTRYVGREVSLTDDFSEDVGLDSIDRLNLMTAIEQTHDIELSDEDIASIANMRDLLNLVKAESGENAPDAAGQGRGAGEAANPPPSGSTST